MLCISIYGAGRMRSTTRGDSFTQLPVMSLIVDDRELRAI